MESKKNLQFNDNFEIFILCFSVSHGARTPDKFSFISHFLVYHRERAREIVGLMAAPSVLETGNISSQWLSFMPSQILIELELSQEVNMTRTPSGIKINKVRPLELDLLVRGTDLRTRICLSEVQIIGSGSVPKCHGSGTLLDASESYPDICPFEKQL